MRNLPQQRRQKYEISQNFKNFYKIKSCNYGCFFRTNLAVLCAASLRARLVATGVGVSLTCLLLLLLVICLVTWTLHRRHRSGRYSVHEKEKLHGASAGVNLYDEPPFGEYVRT